MIYAFVMTLSHRNNCFKAGITVSAASIIVIITSFSTIYPLYPEALEKSIRRSSGIIQRIIANFVLPSPYVPFITTIAAVIYSFIGIILIYYFFVNTESREILFIGIFVISFAFECLRIMVPFTIMMKLPSIYLIMSSRILVFGRYLGLFSFFAASVFTAGLEIRKQENIVFATAAAALIFALGVPIDGLSWDTTLYMQTEFNSSLSLTQIGIFGITMASFFISAYTRGSKEYLLIGLGALLIYAGRNILLSGDTWLSPLPGILFLSLGTWLSCAKLHSINLWL